MIIRSCDPNGNCVIVHPSSWVVYDTYRLNVVCFIYTLGCFVLEMSDSDSDVIEVDRTGNPLIQCQLCTMECGNEEFVPGRFQCLPNCTPICNACYAGVMATTRRCPFCMAAPVGRGLPVAVVRRAPVRNARVYLVGVRGEDADNLMERMERLNVQLQIISIALRSIALLRVQTADVMNVMRYFAGRSYMRPNYQYREATLSDQLVEYTRDVLALATSFRLGGRVITTERMLRAVRRIINVERDHINRFINERRRYVPQRWMYDEFAQATREYGDVLDVALDRLEVAIQQQDVFLPGQRVQNVDQWAHAHDVAFARQVLHNARMVMFAIPSEIGGADLYNPMQ